MFQETYWRIPGKWQANDMRQRSVTIKNIIEGKFVADNDVTTNSRMDESSDEDVETTFDRIRKSFVRSNTNGDTEETANKYLKSSSLVLEELDKENIGFRRNNCLNKRKFMLEEDDDDDEQNKEIPVKKKLPLNDSSDDGDSDTDENFSTKKKEILKDKIVPIKRKSSLDDISDDEDNFVFTKKNSVSVNEKKVSLDSNDKETVSTDVRKESQSEDSNDGMSIVTEKNRLFSSNKRRVLLDDTDEEEFITVQKKQPLEDSDNEDYDVSYQMDINRTEGTADGGEKKNHSDSSDSEEEIGVKRIKRFVNDDSD